MQWVKANNHTSRRPFTTHRSLLHLFACNGSAVWSLRVAAGCSARSGQQPGLRCERRTLPATIHPRNAWQYVPDAVCSLEPTLADTVADLGGPHPPSSSTADITRIVVLCSSRWARCGRCPLASTRDRRLRFATITCVKLWTTQYGAGDIWRPLQWYIMDTP